MARIADPDPILEKNPNLDPTFLGLGRRGGSDTLCTPLDKGCTDLYLYCRTADK